MNSQCVTRTAPSRYLLEWLGVDVPHGTHICPIVDDNIHWNEEILIPYKPMIGCICTVLEIEIQNTNLAGDCGGNMDLIEVCPQNTIYIPVLVKGVFYI